MADDELARFAPRACNSFNTSPSPAAAAVTRAKRKGCNNKLRSWSLPQGNDINVSSLLQQAADANSSVAKVGAIKFQRRVDDDDDWDI
ncbi:hypothetical protein PENSPDRAFT_685337 [Peniophora sp. CONT]|nr:hypothetical protein PENSPDRAFT_685337 [Peniophora sp. CONT]